jgi:DeoR/GlpR family transcriptional regulator of sugar metabolism
VVELAEQFEVAQETIRRDLAKLENIGVVRKVHGGAVTLQNKYEQSLAARFEQGIPQKHEVARLAAELIPPGSTLFVDFGTTTNAFAEHIKHLSDLTILTNSHLIAATLSGSSNNEVYVLGGKYDDSVKANLGPMLIDSIGNFLADFAVIGIGGVKADVGLSNQNIEEAIVARTMIGRSSETIVLADPSKFNRHGIAHVANFHQVDYLVSSEAPNDDIRAALEKNKVTLVLPEG